MMQQALFFSIPRFLSIAFQFFIGSILFGQSDPCTSITPLTCAVNSNYSLTGTGVWNPPGPWGTPGAEAVFSYTAPTTGAYDVQITNNNYYVDLFLSTSCGPAGWTYVNDINTNETSVVNLTAGVTYYFLLDDENYDY